MIVDSHCHAWTVWPYEGPVPDPTSRGSIEQLLFEMDRHGVDEAVVISTELPGNSDNNAYVAREVRRHPDRLVQFVDVDSSWSPRHHTPGAARRLRETVERWGAAGFAHYLGDVNDGWLRTDEAMRLFETAAQLDLVASLSMNPVWLDDLRHVATAVPTLPIVIHHLADIRANDAPDSPAYRSLLAAGAVPNILVKASGFYYGVDEPWDFPYAAQIEVFRRIFEMLGARRMTWGSDFPVSPWMGSTYPQALQLVRRHCAFLEPTDLDWILGGTMETVLHTRRPVQIADVS